MKLSFAKAAAALTLAAAATFAVPMAAQAYPVVPAPGAVAPGGTVSFTVPANSVLPPDSTMTVRLSGENASGASVATIALAAYVSNAPIGTTYVAADGSTSFSITLPSNASGTYQATLVSSDLPGGYNLPPFTVSAAGGSGDSGSLPATGVDSGSLLGLWAGGGALVLAGGAVAVGAAVHRQRKNADA